ncbi:MAG: 3-phosphoshikimate 1-carboxyvinyltransferase [Planctomycetota bacterium]
MSKPHPIAPLSFASHATLSLPGSKSEANRLLVAAALSGQEVTVRGASPSDDVRHLVAGLASLGFASAFVDEARGIVAVGPRRADAPTSGKIFCGNAGTALRFLVSVAAITAGDWVITGDEHMQKRPIQPLVDAWRELGVAIDANNGCPPVRVRGGTSRGGRATVDPTVSSQFVSSLLLVGASMTDGLQIEFRGPLASRGYGELTCLTLSRLGIRASLDNTRASVVSAKVTPPTELSVGGDWSGMGVWTCLNHLTGSRIVADNLLSDSGQSDEQLAERMLALREGGEQSINVEPIPDQFLNLAIVAAFRNGTTHLTGAANVRVKECDRIAVMARELRKLGVDLDEHPDGLTIRGGKPMRGAVIDPENDHRVAMAFALAGMLIPDIAIENAVCVAKSYPTFWGDIERVRAQHRPLALVGMRASGKTTLGMALAEMSGNTFVDTDQRFIAKHGEIAAYVAKHGWPAFRSEEERIVADALKPGNIIATGGGAIESEATRATLANNAEVLWIRADVAFLKSRLTRSKHRPSLTGASVTDEVETVVAKRDPWYRSIADRIVTADQPRPEQLDILLRPLEAFLESRNPPIPPSSSSA